MKKRKSYLRTMMDDLNIAKQNNLHPAIIKEIEDRIAKHKQYKHDYYIKNKDKV